MLRNLLILLYVLLVGVILVTQGIPYDGKKCGSWYECDEGYGCENGRCRETPEG